ncbi:hypothetical protein Tco_0993322 [Tanacetum coccineum]|uniref:Uncharacterized protein n=1 Tax=Tanacetum coccineum TaxID=301880 RepID=A0ABQ5F593_9ASTR
MEVLHTLHIDLCGPMRVQSINGMKYIFVHHEVSRTQALTLLIIPVSVITKSSPVYTNIPQSLQTFTPLPILTTPTSLLTIEATNPLSTFLDFASVFRFNDRITALEKEVAELKKDPLHTQVTTLVDEHLNTRLGETRDEFMKFLSESFTTRMKEQVKDQLPQILPKEVSNFAPPVIEKLIKESHFLLDKMEKSESYLTAPEHRDCYDGLKKYYALEKDCFYSYDVYSLKRGRKDKDKDEDPFDGSDHGLKKRKLSKDAEPTHFLMPIKHGVEKITPTITSEGTDERRTMNKRQVMKQWNKNEVKSKESVSEQEESICLMIIKKRRTVDQDNEY